jgi:hypothetical protein
MVLKVSNILFVRDILLVHIDYYMAMDTKLVDVVVDMLMSVLANFVIFPVKKAYVGMMALMVYMIHALMQQ